MDRLEFIVALTNTLANARCWWPLTVLIILFVLREQFSRRRSRAAQSPSAAIDGMALERGLEEVHAVLPTPVATTPAAAAGLPIAVVPEDDARIRRLALTEPAAAIASIGTLLARAADFTASALGLAQATPTGQQRSLAESRALLAVSSRVDAQTLEALQRLEVLIDRVARREAGFAAPTYSAALLCWTSAVAVIGQLCNSIAHTRRVTESRTEQLAVDEGPPIARTV